MNNKNEASVIAKHISNFLNVYVPSQKTSSANTLRMCMCLLKKRRVQTL